MVCDDTTIVDGVAQVPFGAAILLIDASDWARLRHLPWRFGLAGGRAVVTRQVVREGKTRNLCIYHDILCVEPCRERPVDHINGNPMDNRRSNLRVCTVSENACNVPPQRTKRIPYKGVSRGSKNRFIARIKANGSQIRLGSFTTPEMAARAYDAAAQTHFGEFAWLNRNHFTEVSCA